jgi:hypothetical protein
MAIDPNDWKMAERIAENSKVYKTPAEVLSAFEAFMKQVQDKEEGQDDD